MTSTSAAKTLLSSSPRKKLVQTRDLTGHVESSGSLTCYPASFQRRKQLHFDLNPGCKARGCGEFSSLTQAASEFKAMVMMACEVGAYLVRVEATLSGRSSQACAQT